MAEVSVRPGEGDYGGDSQYGPRISWRFAGLVASSLLLWAAPADAGAPRAPCPVPATAERPQPSGETGHVASGEPADSVESILKEIEHLNDLAVALRQRFEDDPSYHYLLATPQLKETVDAHLDLLAGGFAPGEEGIRCAAEIVAGLRVAVLEGYAALPYYQMRFTGQTVDLPDAPPPPDRFRLELDFTAARTVMEILGEPEHSVSGIDGRLEGGVFDALVSHRNQDFYPVRVDRQMLARNLQRAASDAPLDRLYRYAFPIGSMHYSEVREELPRYVDVVADLEAAEPRIAAGVAAAVLPYLPPGTRFDRTVHFAFGDGADGWVSQGIAAVDLEFFKDDFSRLLPVLIHETFHAAQSEVRREWSDHPDGRLNELAGVLETVYQEGTATFVAPAQPKSPEEAMSLAVEGLEMLERVREGLLGPAPDEALVRELRNRGVQGAGPFYWLGAEMSRTIVGTLGTAALASALEEGGVRFFELYLQAGSEGGSLPAFSEDLRAAIRTLAGADAAARR